MNGFFVNDDDAVINSFKHRIVGDHYSAKRSFSLSVLTFQYLIIAVFESRGC